MNLRKYNSLVNLRAYFFSNGIEWLSIFETTLSLDQKLRVIAIFRIKETGEKFKSYF